MKNIHERALEIIGRYLRSETEVIKILQEIDENRKYRDKNCRSLFEYATHILKLSEPVAYAFINVGRKAKEVPALQMAIEHKEISVSTARKLTSVITTENSSEWIEKAKTLTQPKLEQEVARINPKSAVQEKAKYVTEERLKLEMGISKVLLQKLRRVQDLESKNKAASLEEILDIMIELYLEKRDPVRIQRRVEKKRAEQERSTSKQPSQLFSRTVRSKSYALLKREVLTRDDARCTHRDKNDMRCTQTRYLHVHHVLPKDLGGADTAGNLATLCSFHHKQLHRQLPL